MKEYHYNVLSGVISALQLIFEDGKYADKAIEKILKSNTKWGSRDRKTIAETTYEIVRWYRLLNYTLNPQESEVHNHWHLLGAYFVIKNFTYPQWKEFDGLNVESIKKYYNYALGIRKLKNSIPDWLDSLGAGELGFGWDKELEALNEQAKVVLRVNTLLTTTRQLKNDLLKSGIETELLSDYPDALVLAKRQNVFQLPQFKNGFFEVQDAGSQSIATFLQAKEGMRIIDACAGAGGKSLHLAAQMKNRGQLICMDVEAWKLEELKKRARRGKVNNIEIRHIDSTKVIKRLEGTADRLLLDVPCSGLGVLRRNPDAKWKLSQKFLDEVRITQQDILQRYSLMIKVGGKMVYATCSIFPSENQNQVQNFLVNQKDQFILEEEKTILPSEGFDGFYMARLIKV